MPMLERTAASLESCTFQRVLPVAATSLKSRRSLHTTFWQHGAADIELSNAWQTLLRIPFESLDLLTTPQSTRTESTTASTFLLDFLYPKGATSLLRNLSPTVLHRYERPRLHFRSPATRLFTSSASLQQDTPPTAQDTDEAPSSVEHATATATATGPEAEAEASQEVKVDARPSDAAVGAPGHNPEQVQASDDSGTPEAQDGLEKLMGLLQMRNEAELDNIVYLFRRHQDKIGKPGTKAGQALQDKVCDFLVGYCNLNESLVSAIKQKQLGLAHDVWRRHPEKFRQRLFDLDVLKKSLFEGILTHGLLTSLCHRPQGYKSTGEDAEVVQSFRDSITIPLARDTCTRWELEQAISTATLLKDPLQYEDCILRCAELKHTTLAAKLYREYRVLPEVKVRVFILHAMIRHVFFPSTARKADAGGLAMVKADWYNRYKQLDTWGYHKFLTFHASRGDVLEVQRLREEYLESRYGEYERNQVLHHDAVYWVSSLQAHAVRGELNAARRVFDEAQKSLHTKLSMHYWNILLNAHAKAREYDAAIRFFEVLCASAKPDHYSFGTIMGMSGSRGDLEYTLELYRSAKELGLEPTAPMVDSVVEAYCQNDQFNQAESIVLVTTQAQRLPLKECTALWNSLLFHHAHRRDLTTLNRLLNRMAELEVPYDSETYDNLLRCLAYCKQHEHAFYLLKVAMQEHEFQPTHNHFVLLMFAFIRSKISPAALKTSGMLHNFGFPKTAQVLLRVSEALGTYAGAYRGTPIPHTADADQARSYLLIALREYRKLVQYNSEGGQPSPKAPMTGPTTVNTVAHITDQAALLVFLFAQMREFTTVRDIIDLWYQSSSENAKDRTPPMKLLNAFMVSDFYEGKYTEVEETWRVVWEQANEMARPRGAEVLTERTLAGRQMLLNEPVRTMIRTYAATGDHVSMRNLVVTVTNAGFKLNAKNWNFYIQCLASMQKWADAFTACEDHLMSQWTGWYRSRAKQHGPTRIPLEQRRMGASPRHLRPISHTLLVLAKAYMDVEQMSAWSGEAGRLFRTICETCPRVVGAVTSMTRIQSPLEKRVLEGGRIAPEPETEQTAAEAMSDYVAQETALLSPAGLAPPPPDEWRDADGNLVAGWTDEYDATPKLNSAARRQLRLKAEAEAAAAAAQSAGLAPPPPKKSGKAKKQQPRRKSEAKAQPAGLAPPPRGEWRDADGNLVSGWTDEHEPPKLNAAAKKRLRLKGQELNVDSQGASF